MKNRLEGLFRGKPADVLLDEEEFKLDEEEYTQLLLKRGRSQPITPLDVLSLLGLIAFVLVGMAILGIVTGTW